MTRPDELAHVGPSERRDRLGPVRELEPSGEGRLITLLGVLEAAVEVVAQTHVSTQGILASHRCRASVVLRVGRQPVLLEGRLAVVVGSEERLRVVAPHGIVSFRELRNGSVARARGRLRRVPAPGPQRYRADASIWALCATGTADAVDVASELAPELLERPSLWQRLTETGEPTSPSTAEVPPSLRELMRRRRERAK
ncbi:MAG: hypothetical protein RIF41_11735 [Polyangiaceae bacterium]